MLNHPIDEVFNVLGVGDHMERVVRIYDLCNGFELGVQDTVATPDRAPLAQSSVRTLPSARADQGTDALPRRAFVLQEAVPVLFGLVTTNVRIAGVQTWDPTARVALYESLTDGSVAVRTWKLRRFEEELDDMGVKKTRVEEFLRIRAPALFKSVVQKEASKGHRCGVRFGL